MKKRKPKTPKKGKKPKKPKATPKVDLKSQIRAYYDARGYRVIRIRDASTKHEIRVHVTFAEGCGPIGLTAVTLGKVAINLIKKQ